MISPIRLVERTAPPPPFKRSHRKKKIDPEAEDRLGETLPLEFRRHHTAYVTRLRAQLAARDAAGTLVERDDLPVHKGIKSSGKRIK